MTNVEKLKERLADIQVAGFSVFPGSTSATPEQVAGELLKSFDRLERGEFTVLAELGD